MPDPFIGEIRAFAFDYPPLGWELCYGQLLSIGDYSALYSLLGTRYGGNGTTNFGLPDLRGRAAIGFGQGPGLYPYQMGNMGGLELVTLLPPQMPAHNHALNADAEVGNKVSPEDNFFAEIPFAGAKAYIPERNNGVVMNEDTIGMAGGSQPHENRSPYLAINFCIATDGEYPPRH